MRTFEYRVYPNREQSSLLMQCLIESRMLYNQMLAMVKTQYAEQETFPSKYELESAFKGQGEHVPATTVQMLADRLSKPLKRFLAAQKAGYCRCRLSALQEAEPLALDPTAAVRQRLLSA